MGKFLRSAITPKRADGLLRFFQQTFSWLCCLSLIFREPKKWVFIVLVELKNGKKLEKTEKCEKIDEGGGIRKFS